jgi:hypothetical protein
MSWEYAITDVAGEHFWTGSGFLPVEEWDLDRQAILCFASEDGARLEVLRQRKRGMYLKVVRQLIRQEQGAAYLLAHQDVADLDSHRLN